MSRLTTFSDDVRGKSSKTSTDSGQVYFATPSRLEELLQLGERRRGGARLEDDRPRRPLAEPVVGQRHDGGLVDRRVAQDDRLDLGGHDRDAAAADDVLAAADVDEVAVLVEVAEVAGAVAAPVGQRLARELVVVEEAEEAARPVDDHGADLARPAAAPVLVDDADLGASNGRPSVADDLLLGLVEAVRRVAGHLGEAVVGRAAAARRPRASPRGARRVSPGAASDAQSTSRSRSVACGRPARTSAPCVGMSST